MLVHARADVLAKIAATTAAAVRERQRRGSAGTAAATSLARGKGEGEGWSVSDVVCTCGPSDRAFEEMHTQHSIGVVLSGTFQYRSSEGRHVMSAGSFLLGNPGDSYECDHEHAAGDRCVAFHYSTEYLERITAELLGRNIRPRFGATRFAPARELSGVVACTAVALSHPAPARIPWNELAVRIAVAALSFDRQRTARFATPTAAVASRITEQIRAIELDPSIDASLDTLAAETGLSPFAYLRTFERLTGATPHQLLLRARLRRAAVRLETESAKVIDVAFSSGFGDVSNFNKAFRAEFGVTPTAYRRGVASM